MRDRIGELVRDFALGAHHGQEGNVSIGGDTLYSYSMPIAWRRGGGLVVVNRDDSPSSTTSKHITKLIVCSSAEERPSESDCRRLGINPDEVTRVTALQANGPMSMISGKGFTINREGADTLYLVKMDSRAFRVPHYHQVDTKHGYVWFRSADRPVHVRCLRLWQLMLTGHDRKSKRRQKKLVEIFQDDRLAQYGPWLLEKLPEHTVPKKHQITDLVATMGFGGPHVTTLRRDTRDSDIAFGSLNRKRVMDEKIWYRLHRDVLQMLPYVSHSGTPINLWDQPAVSLPEVR